jgi:hypothetical protein
MKTLHTDTSSWFQEKQTLYPKWCLGAWMFCCLMVFNVTFNNISAISWRSVLLVEETGGPGENHRPVASHWQTLSHNVVHLALIEIGTDCIGSCKSNYHAIMATTAPCVHGWETAKFVISIVIHHPLSMRVHLPLHHWDSSICLIKNLSKFH